MNREYTITEIRTLVENLALAIHEITELAADTYDNTRDRERIYQLLKAVDENELPKQFEELALPDKNLVVAALVLGLQQMYHASFSAALARYEAAQN